MERPTTPVLQTQGQRQGQAQGHPQHPQEQENPKDSPRTVRAKVRGIVEFCDAKHIPYFKTDVFKFYGISYNRGYEYLRNGSSNLLRDNRDDPNREETRGRKRLVSAQKVREMEKLLEEEDRTYSWDELGHQVGLDCSGRTVRRYMGTMDFHKCISCRRGWCNSKLAKERLEWAQVMLGRYPEPDNWQNVRFSDEIHFGWDDQVGKVQIIQKPGQRYCFDCIQAEVIDEPEEKDKNRHHCWAAAGHNFKSDMYFYDVPGHGQGKLSQQMYLDQILEPIVKPWIQMGQNFVLEEDGDAGGNGGGKSSRVRSWKNKHGLKYFFSCGSSPDLSPLDNLWQPPPQQHQPFQGRKRKYLHWDELTTKEMIYERWSHVSQKTINDSVSTMPERLRAVIIGEGRMTFYWRLESHNYVYL